jgi:hypothetical protein
MARPSRRTTHSLFGCTDFSQAWVEPDAGGFEPFEAFEPTGGFPRESLESSSLLLAPHETPVSNEVGSLVRISEPLDPGSKGSEGSKVSFASASSSKNGGIPGFSEFPVGRTFEQLLGSKWFKTNLPVFSTA